MTEPSPPAEVSPADPVVLQDPADGRVVERRKDSFFHEFRGTGVPQILLGAGELLIPVLALLSFDDVARDLGIGLLGSLGLILFFAAATYRRAFRRGEERRRLAEAREDPIDLVEEVEDHWTDFFRAVALALVFLAMVPTTRYVIDIQDVVNTWVFLLSDAVVIGASLMSAWEGWRRRQLHVEIADGRYFGPGGAGRIEASDE